MTDHKDDLLPCPFCGGTNLQSGGVCFVGFWCLDCEAQGPNHYGRYEWNTRADLAQSALDAYVKAKVDEALEKAAGVAKALSEKWRDGRISPNSELHAILYREGMADGAYHIYNAIRAMKEGE